MKTTALWSLTVLALAGCTRPVESVATARREGTVVEGRQEGLWRYRDAQGRLEAQGSFAADKPSGAWVWWYPDGHQRALGAYDAHGKRTGWWTLFNADGSVRAAGRFDRDRQVGEWWFRLADGGERRVTYRDGKPVPPAPAPATAVAAAPAPTPVAATVAAPVAVPVAGSGPVAATPAPEAAPVTPAHDLPVVKPVAVPGTWTVGEERKAATLVRAFAEGPQAAGDYDWSQAKPLSSTAGAALVGKTLTNRRFLSSTGSVLDLGRAKRPTVLVIMRGFSGNICLYCATQTAALAQAADRFRQAGVDLVVLFPGPAESLPAFLEAVQTLRAEPPPMPVALDASLDLVLELGLVDDLSKPTALVIDPGARIRWAYIGASLDDRPSVPDLLRAAETPR